ncbi:DUF3079 domain-containing protein [Phytopseudomonas punonensis]|nr:DUF3079 domain-containing protein [Pseudomonas punonensis]
MSPVAQECGNGAARTQHTSEMLGDDWYLHGDWGIEPPDAQQKPKQRKV